MKLATPLVCTCTALIHDGHTLLGFALERQDNLGRNLMCGWQWPGGKVGLDDMSLEVAAVREVAEETGIEVPAHRLGLFAVLRMWDFVTFCYVVNLTGERPVPKDMEPTKNRDWKWFPWERVETLLKYEEGHYHHATAVRSGLPQPMFPPLAAILRNGAKRRQDRAPGAPTHCMLCNEQLPCRCLKGTNEFQRSNHVCDGCRNSNERKEQ